MSSLLLPSHLEEILASGQRLRGAGYRGRFAPSPTGPLQPGGHGFNPSKVLLDPCARAIAGWGGYRRAAAVGAAPNTASCLKGVVTERERFDFAAAPRPRHSWQRSVIYELHLGGFTSGSGSPVPAEQQGTLLGLIQTIPYLKGLGVTTIELLPVMAFDPRRGVQPHQRGKSAGANPELARFWRSPLLPAKSTR